ncbi:hypothetical protein B9Z55_021506 [Caenorhabditis nigoni]|uniref:Uncharacterized protein n=1 Tax=Caenorhabditis nigoni TaxID=1611254 RepID=A0A2G5TS93_9PELO|nr:hypothetical protein B9Z55_021506 [Caenorhabditis nigoni]
MAKHFEAQYKDQRQVNREFKDDKAKRRRLHIISRELTRQKWSEDRRQLINLQGEMEQIPEEHARSVPLGYNHQSAGERKFHSVLQPQLPAELNNIESLCWRSVTIEPQFGVYR